MGLSRFQRQHVIFFHNFNLTVQFIHKSVEKASQLLPDVKVDICSMVIKGLLPLWLGDHLWFSHYRRHFQLLQGVLQHV